MACTLVPVPGTFSDFEAPTGAQVTLVTKDHIGVVLLASATYAGADLVPVRSAVPSIAFTIVAGQKTLKLVAVFSASTAGRGELREQSSLPPETGGGGADSQFLIDLPGKDPFQVIRITGK